MDIDSLNEKTIKAIKQLLTGLVTKEEINEYQLDDENGQMKLIKQRVKINSIPPNADIIKLLFNKQEKTEDYQNYTDEELLKEKQKLLNQLKEEDDDS